MELKLSKKYTLDGKETDIIKMDFEKMTGADILDAEKTTLYIDGMSGAVLELSKAYMLNIASIATGIPAEELKKLNLKDFTNLTIEVQAQLGGL